jgi:hypothetical protein
MGPLASEPDDVSVSARDRPPAERERYMREYLAWEIDLALIARSKVRSALSRARLWQRSCALWWC